MSKGSPGYVDAPLVDSSQAWDELNDWLPEMCKQLLATEPFGHASPPPRQGRGVYLFSTGTEHLYVGRTGITARTRAANKEPKTNFFQRWGQHTNATSSPSSAPFAIKLTRELAGLLGFETPLELKARFELERSDQWWSLRKREDPPDYCLAFEEAKRFIREELDYRVLAFDDDVRGVRSHVAEVYVDTTLQTTYGDFSTS